MAEDPNTPPDTPEEPDPELVILGEVFESRAVQAYLMKQAGHTLREIADDLGYATDEEVAHAIKERLKTEAKHITSAGRAGLLQLEIDRLEALHKAYWRGALAGDREDAKFVLQVADRLIKLTQLDSLDTATQQARVLVVSGSEQDYVEKLKELTE